MEASLISFTYCDSSNVGLINPCIGSDVIEIFEMHLLSSM